MKVLVVMVVAEYVLLVARILAVVLAVEGVKDRVLVLVEEHVPFRVRGHALPHALVWQVKLSCTWSKKQ